MRQGFRYRPPPLNLLISLGNEELCRVAKNIAKAHYLKQQSLTPEDFKGYCQTSHEYGIAIKLSSTVTLDGILMRLRSEAFWRERVNRIADLHREQEAMRRKLLGDSGKGLMPYCSDQTYTLFEDRRSSILAKMQASLACHSTGLTKSDLYRNSEKAKANQLYLTLKAMDALATSRNYEWAMITLTCPPRFHPSSKRYDGSSLRDGNNYLHALYRKLFKHLGKSYKANDDYFGVRIVEAHLDGCPHWHILLYSSMEFFMELQSKLEVLYSQDDRPGKYFQNFSDQIIKTKHNCQEGARPLSYIFKHLAFGLNRRGREDELCMSKRNSYALRAAGVRQYQLIGAQGVATKVKALRKVANDSRAPRNLKKLASTLIAAHGNNRSHALKGMVNLLNESSMDVEFIRKKCVNRYREPVSRMTSVKHRKDALCYELRRTDYPSAGAVTINGSRKKKRALSPLKLSIRYPKGHYRSALHTHSAGLPTTFLQYCPPRLRWKPPWPEKSTRSKAERLAGRQRCRVVKLPCTSPTEAISTMPRQAQSAFGDPPRVGCGTPQVGPPAFLLDVAAPPIPQFKSHHVCKMYFKIELVGKQANSALCRVDQ